MLMCSFIDEKGDSLTLFKKNILVRMEKVKEKTKSGIVLPEMRQEVLQGRIDKGKLLCLAEDVTAEDFGLKEFKLEIGDVIFVHRYAGIELEIDGHPHKIVKAEDVYACLRKAEDKVKD